MIKLQNIYKTYRLKQGSNEVLKDLSHVFKPGCNVGILGRNGAGKSTLMRIISGTELPDRGSVIRTSAISWPLGFAGGFHGSLTGRENMRFVCRIYGADIKKVTGFVEEFAMLGPYMDMPINTYSSGMSAKLAFGLSMAIDFDFYLIDEVTSVGDISFRERSQAVFNERKARTTLLVVSHSMGTIRAHCDEAMVLHDGQLIAFPDIDQAEAYYQEVCRGATLLPFVPPPPANARPAEVPIEIPAERRALSR